MTNESFLSKTGLVRSALIRGKTAADFEDAGRRWSATWKEGVLSYQSFFGRVFETPFRDFLIGRRQEGKNTFVLDLMSPGAVLHQLPIQGGLAVSLGDGRTDEEKMADRENGIDLATGNVLLIEPWKKIHSWLFQHNIDGFDLILCRPDGGLDPSYIPEIKGVYYSLINRAWNVLSPDNGVLLTQVPYHLHYLREYSFSPGPVPKKEMDKWLQLLLDSNIGVNYDFQLALKLVRNPNSPQNLPVLH